MRTSSPDPVTANRATCIGIRRFLWSFGCTAPSADDLANVEVATDMSHANGVRVLPDFAVTTYSGDNSCVIYVDPANTVAEGTKANNTLVDNVHFTSGLPGDGKCKD